MNFIIGALILWFSIGLLTSIVKLIIDKIRAKNKLYRIDFLYLFLVFPFAGVFWTAFFVSSFSKSAVKWMMKVVW